MNKCVGFNKMKILLKLGLLADLYVMYSNNFVSLGVLTVCEFTT